MLDFYIHRTLHGRDGPILDCELFGRSGVFVVLAEPGAGKTDLLKFLGEQYDVQREPGNLFVHRPVSPANVLVIDALDEVARIGEEKINEIIVKARSSGAATVIFASRSYFWDQARTSATRVCFGTEPNILRLEPFDDDEQQQLFAHYKPHEDFTAFKSEVERFELEPILGNPQFLQLFADAYVEGGRRFSSKKQIYADAVRRLASENREAAAATRRPAINDIIAVAGEIYAKLLLLGASGISTNEDIDEGTFPYLRGIISNALIADIALNTRLFRPTDSVNRHEPIHRIVAEYGAADFLVKRIEAPGNALSLRRCLSVIAPNSTVRSELRGLVGWMASLGNRETQETMVDLDPYAVFANGDASQLLASVKPRLLRGLRALAETDPFFRRMDSWRKFNVAGFFSTDMVEHVRPFLARAHSKSHLLGLMLELLHGTDAGNGLHDEFRAILLDNEAEDSDRQRAYQNIVAIAENGSLNDFDALVRESTRDSLDIASQMLAKNGVSHFGRDRTLAFVKALTTLYPEGRKREIGLGPTYFAKRTFSDFSTDDIRFLLDEISGDLACTCGKQKPYACTCRRGKSKVAGLLLDRYFESMFGPRDPKQIGRWTERLIFSQNRNSEQSASMAEMAKDHGLRREIQISRIGHLRDPEKIREGIGDLFVGSTHSGLHLREGDYDAFVDHALDSGNHALWRELVVRHNPYDTSRQFANPTRARMRAQAHTSSALQRIWAKVNRDYAASLRRDHVRFGHSRTTIERRDAEQKAKFLADFKKDRHLIEAGRHGGWLRELSRRYLHGAHTDDPIIDDKKLIETALLSCFDFLSAQIPSLTDLSEGRGGAIPMILEAACLATFRHSGSINAVHSDILRVVRAGNPGGSGYSEGESTQLIANIDRILFPSDAEKTDFATRLIEPQLASEEDDAATKVHLIDHGDTFESVKGTLPIEWLSRYPKMPWNARNTLFNIAVTHSDPAQLRALIEARCNDPIVDTEKGLRCRQFWLLRHFFFILPTSVSLWAEFSSEPKSILQIEQYAGRLSRHDAVGWPRLKAEQIYRVLDAFVEIWPKVHLPSSWGSDDPPEKTAYRFLSEIIFTAGQDAPSDSIPIFDRLLADDRFTELHSSIKSLRAEAARQHALAGFTSPSTSNVSTFLNDKGIASVEDMRALLIEMLDAFQKELKGGATNRADVFYSGSKRVNENTGRNRVVEALQDRFHSLNLGVTVEHQMIAETRCDFTVSTMIDGSNVILATEMKGQWNPGLFTAAAEQLTARYSIFPGAADQGVYLVLWFGPDFLVAGRKEPSLSTPELLRQEIVKRMPPELAGRIDVYVLDVSRSRKAKRRPKASKGKTQRRPARTTKATAKPRAKPAKKASVKPGKPKSTASKATRSKPNAKGTLARSKTNQVKKAPSIAAAKDSAPRKPSRATAKVVTLKSKTGQRKKTPAKPTKKASGSQATMRAKTVSRKAANGASKSKKRPAKKPIRKGR